MKIRACLLMISVIAFYSYAHFLSNIWPQKKIESKEFGESKADRKVLIGGISSQFKDEIVKAVVDSLKNDSVYVKTAGLSQLRNENPEKWNAVFILNTCIGWEIDSRVNKFLRSYPNYHSFVVLTTSGDPDSCGKSSKLPANIDVISSASNNTKKDEVIKNALEMIRKKIKE